MANAARTVPRTRTCPTAKVPPKERFGRQIPASKKSLVGLGRGATPGLLAPDHRFEVIPQVAVVHCHKAPNVKRSKLHLVRLLITRVCGLLGRVSQWVSCVCGDPVDGQWCSCHLYGDGGARAHHATGCGNSCCGRCRGHQAPAQRASVGLGPTLHRVLLEGERVRGECGHAVHLPVGGTKKGTHNFVSSCGPKARVCN